MGYLWDGANHGLGQAATIVVPLVALTWINVRGVKSGARTAVVLAFGKIVPLLVLVCVGIFAIDWNRVFPVPMPDSGNFMKAALLVLFAYAGFENTAAPAGEFKNPQRDVPFALIVHDRHRDGDLHARAARRDRHDPEPRRSRRRRSPTRAGCCSVPSAASS